MLNCRQICLYHKIDNIITGVTNFIDVIIEREGRLRRFFRFVTGILLPKETMKIFTAGTPTNAQSKISWNILLVIQLSIVITRDLSILFEHTISTLFVIFYSIWTLAAFYAFKNHSWKFIQITSLNLKHVKKVEQ